MPASTAAQKNARAARRARKVTEEQTTAKTTTTTTKPAARKTRTTSADAKTITVTFNREREPQGNGGVRFGEAVAKGKKPIMRTAYIDQATDKAMGNPQTITVTIAAA